MAENTLAKLRAKNRSSLSTTRSSVVSRVNCLSDEQAKLLEYSLLFINASVVGLAKWLPAMLLCPVQQGNNFEKQNTAPKLLHNDNFLFS